MSAVTNSDEENDLHRKLEMFIRNVIPQGREWILTLRVPVPGDEASIWQAGQANSKESALSLLIGAAYGQVQHLNEGDGLYHPEA